jgi:hypothetical protein
VIVVDTRSGIGNLSSVHAIVYPVSASLLIVSVEAKRDSTLHIFQLLVRNVTCRFKLKSSRPSGQIIAKRSQTA